MATDTGMTLGNPGSAAPGNATRPTVADPTELVGGSAATPDPSPFASREELCVTSSQPGQPEPTVPSASQYAAARPPTPARPCTGSWQVKVHDPTNLLAGHDGWVLLGEGWPTLGDACAATGLSNRS